MEKEPHQVLLVDLILKSLNPKIDKRHLIGLRCYVHIVELKQSHIHLKDGMVIIARCVRSDLVKEYIIAREDLEDRGVITAL